MFECCAGPSLPPDVYARVIRDAIFMCFKWDLRHGDALALCPYPLVISAETWQWLACAAEALAAEALVAEAEILKNPVLHRELGLPMWLLRALDKPHADRGVDPVRVMRFDFHPCLDGFHVSEGNIDAASGFIEAAGVTALMASEYGGLEATGDPAASLAAALREHLGESGIVGLLHLSVFTDDRQVMLYLAQRLREAGLRTELMDPSQLRWCEGSAMVLAAPLDAIFRFIPAQWLARLPVACEPRRLVTGSARTCVVNPVHAVLTQSKRFPIFLDQLRASLPTWRALVPETRDPTMAPWEHDDSWLLKPALAHEGDRVAIRGVTPPERLQAIERSVVRYPRAWAAQRRFDAVAVATPSGPQYPCIGVYVINGRACGSYGRIAPRSLIDGNAQDVIVLKEV